MAWLQAVAGLTAFLVPWVLVALLLGTLPGQAWRPGDRYTALGLGFFLSLALVAWSLRWTAPLADALPVLPLLLAFALLAGLLAWLGRHRLRQRLQDEATEPAASPPGPELNRWVLRGLLLLALFHFTYAALEIVTLPVFPWDGWTVWTYRAKAWFHTELLISMTGFNGWFWQGGFGDYTTPAPNYPWLPSLVTLWAALGLGQWHESLVNLPVLLAGVALALGLAGLLRTLEFRAGALVLVTYLLFSTPMLATHLSLGGYADIWLCGFAGLGLAVLMTGLLTDRPLLLWLGLASLALGAGVKIEGYLWLLLGIALIGLTRLPWRWLLGLALFGALCLAAMQLTGQSTVELPGVGAIGMSNGLLAVPGKGLVRLELFDVRDAYLQNAFSLGSWHLFWPMLACVLLGLLLRQPRSRLTRISWTFFGLFAALQAFVFVFTTEGAWAQDYTAINRMPLQLLPALLFLLVAGAGALLRSGASPVPGASVWKPALAGGALAAVVALVSVMALQARDVAEDAPEPRPIAGDQLRFVVGGGTRNDSSFSVTRFEDGIAILSSGQVDLDPSQYGLLDLQLTFDGQLISLDQAPAFFWRRADQPRTVNRITLLQSGLVDLSRSEDWRGRIIEFGFFFVDHGREAGIAEARFLGDSLAQRLRLIPLQWLTFDGWTQRSAHWIAGGDPAPLVPLTPLVTLTMLLGALLSWLFAGRRQGTLLLTGFLLLGWVLVDLRWLAERHWQARQTWQQLTHLSVDERMAEGELAVFYPWLRSLKQDVLGDQPQRIMIIPDPSLEPYFGLRAKYQLLPHSSALSQWRPSSGQLQRIDYLLFLGPHGAPQALDQERDAQRWRRLRIPEEARPALELVSQVPEGTLYRVRSLSD